MIKTKNQWSTVEIIYLQRLKIKIMFLSRLKIK